MAGIKLPDYHALGEPMAPNVPQGVARYNNAEAPGQSTVGFGQELQKTGIDLKQLQDVADINNVQANVLQPKLDALAQNFYSLQGVAAMNAFKGDPENNVPSYNQQVMQAVNDSANQLTGSARESIITAGVAQAKSEMYRAAAHSGTQMVQYAEQSHQAAQEMETQQITAAVSSNDTLAAQDGIKMYQTRQGLHDNSMGNATGSDLYNYHQQQSNDKLAQAILQAQPGATQQQLMRKLISTPATAPANGGAADLGADTVKPYSAQQVADIQAMVTKPSAYDDLFQKYGQEYGVDPKELKLHAAAESSMNARADNGTAAGLMQLTAATAKGLGVTDRLDPEQSIMGAAKLMAQQSQAAGGSIHNADMLYYGGADQGQWGANTKQYAANLAAVRGTPGQYADNTTQTNDAGGNISSTAPAVVAKPTLFGIPISPSTVPKLTEMANANASHEALLMSRKNDAAFQKTQDDFFKKSDPSNPTLTWKDIQSSNLPVDGVGGKDWWVERLNKTEKTDPAVFNDLMQRAMMPDGAPGKLTDPKELQGNIGKGITYSDMEHIKTVMEGGDPGKEALKLFYKQGHDQLSKTNMMDIDGQGERRAYNWYMATSKLIADGQAKGIPVNELIDPTNKNYVGNNTQQFTEDLVTQGNNLATSMRVNAPSQPLPVEKQRKAGEGIADYNKRLGIGGGL